MVAPLGQIKREVMYMSKNWMNMIWSWDHCFNAMAMAPVDKEVSWNQLMCIFDHQSEIGSLPDGFDDQKEYWGILKTPIHGWALKYMLEHNTWITTEQLNEIYGPLSRWTDFWFTHRDYDGNGIPQYHHSYESLDDCTPLDVGFPIEAPEVCTFLILQMDVLSDVAGMLGKKEEAAGWKERSNTLLTKMIDRLWEGNRFVAKRVGTETWNKESKDFLQFVPLLLGEKLPLPIRKAMVSNLRTIGLITPFGVATESPNSPLFDPSSYTRGSIWAPVNMFIINGLKNCGEDAFAKEISDIYCNQMVKGGFPEKFGAEKGEIQADPEYTWTSSVFLLLSKDFSFFDK
jgi:glycogen debranching enzyme